MEKVEGMFVEEVVVIKEEPSSIPGSDGVHDVSIPAPMPSIDTLIIPVSPKTSSEGMIVEDTVVIKKEEPLSTPSPDGLRNDSTAAPMQSTDTPITPVSLQMDRDQNDRNLGIASDQVFLSPPLGVQYIC